MTENAFLDKNFEPDEIQVRKILRGTYPVYEEIDKFVKNSVGETIKEWKFYGAKNGWVLKTLFHRRNLFFISIYDDFFKISFIFGERAIAAILKSDLSDELKKVLSEARKYAEGRGLSLTVNDNSYLEEMRTLIIMKVAK